MCGSHLRSETFRELNCERMRRMRYQARDDCKNSPVPALVTPPITSSSHGFECVGGKHRRIVLVYIAGAIERLRTARGTPADLGSGPRHAIQEPCPRELSRSADIGDAGASRASARLMRSHHPFPTSWGRINKRRSNDAPSREVTWELDV
ncbi:hypothetical protein EVAR_59468_1 [Eumeta japonica]|uniref:Uncharacterized protein n=1 Tax=Eumeta variegata TaxID=151549 RepID=A0A4C1YZD9_EUMVA|nr:hypothetical protein EVAR_59468_1 [Eumeta japonica]